jgi:hypothetical protein
LVEGLDQQLDESIRRLRSGELIAGPRWVVVVAANGTEEEAEKQGRDRPEKQRTKRK